MDLLKQLGGSRFIANLLDYGNVILANKLQNGRLLILKKEPGNVFSNALWAQFSDEEKKSFRQELVEAFTFLRRHNLVHKDPRKDNILWKREEQKIVLLDLEYVIPATENDPLDSAKGRQVACILNMKIVT